MPYRIRSATPKDIPEIAARHREQNERDGTSYPMPEIYDMNGKHKPNVPLALVTVDGEEVKQGVVFERAPIISVDVSAVEMSLFGKDPKATAQLEREISNAFYLLRSMGYHVVHSFVPKQVVIPIEKPFRRAGFERDDFRLAHFLMDLTKNEEGERSPDGEGGGEPNEV